MDERAQAIALAHRLLDEPNCDPDDDLRILARQLLRAREGTEHVVYAYVKDDGSFRVESDITTQQKADDYVRWYYGTVAKAAAEGRRMVQCVVSFPVSASRDQEQT
jgi:hypothetical protein